MDIAMSRMGSLKDFYRKMGLQPFQPYFDFHEDFTSPDDRTFKVDGVSFTMRRVEGGSCILGAKSKEEEVAYWNKTTDPRYLCHVTVDSFYIAETQVTQELWKAVMGEHPGTFVGKELPVNNVSWNDCMEFVAKLNALTNGKFRMPTEAEWEFAARGGVKSKGYQYAGSDKLDEVGWYHIPVPGMIWDPDEEKVYELFPVKQLEANELGLYDMSGNVREWCADWDAFYPVEPQVNPKGPAEGKDKITRGGSGWDEVYDCTVYRRIAISPDKVLESNGFRLAMDV